MTITKSQIIGALPSLTTEELNEIQAVCASLAYTDPAVKLADLSSNAIAVYDALASVLGAQLPLTSLPEGLQQRYRRKLPTLLNFFSTDLPGWDSNRIAQKSFLIEMIQLLYDDLKRLEITPTFTTIINSFHRMYEVFDRAFPGYRQSGAIQLVFNFDKFTDPSMQKRTSRVAKTDPAYKNNS